MRGRLVALAGALALALVLPSAVLADTLPSGSYASWRTADCTSGPCTFTLVSASLTDGVAQACAEQHDYDATGQEVAVLSGCTTPLSAGSLTFSQGYIVGLATTAVLLDDGDGTTRSISVAVSSAISGRVVVTSESGTYVDDATGCPASYSSKTRTVSAAGTATIGGVSQDVSGESQLVASKFKVRC